MEDNPFWSPSQDPALVPFRRKFDAARDPLTARNALGISESGGIIGGGPDSGGPIPTTEIVDLTTEVHGTQIWLYWTALAGSKGTVVYRSRNSGTPPLFSNWEACRVGYPGGFYKDGCEGPLDSGRYYTYQAAAYYNGGEGPLCDPITARTNIPFQSGYQVFVFYNTNATSFGIISEYQAVYTLAAEPTQVPWSGSNLYYFISTQDLYFNAPAGHQLTLLQPVIQFGSYGDADNPEFGGDYWVAANWVLDRGHFYISDSVTLDLSVTTTLTGKIKRNGALDYTVSFVELPAIDLHVTGVGYEAHVAGVGYEAYGPIDDWSGLPGPIQINVLNLNGTVIGANAPVTYSLTRAVLSDTSREVDGNGTHTPIVYIESHLNNDWVPVNM